jgi:hypothetical protein
MRRSVAFAQRGWGMPEDTPEGKCFWRALQKLLIRPRAHPVWARTTWPEGRGESTEAQRGIFRTVVNRAAKSGWWDNDVVSVILTPFQFPCFIPADANPE